MQFADIPLVTKVPELTQTPRGTHVVPGILDTDEIGLEVSCRVVEVLAPEAGTQTEAGAVEEELTMVEAEADVPAEPQPAADGKETRVEADATVAPPLQDSESGGAPATT